MSQKPNKIPDLYALERNQKLHGSDVKICHNCDEDLACCDMLWYSFVRARRGMPQSDKYRFSLCAGCKASFLLAQNSQTVETRSYNGRGPWFFLKDR